MYGFMLECTNNIYYFWSMLSALFIIKNLILFYFKLYKPKYLLSFLKIELCSALFSQRLVKGTSDNKMTENMGSVVRS